MGYNLLTTPTVLKCTFYVAWVVQIHVCTYVCLCVVEVSKAVAREIRMMQSGKGSLNMEGMSH